MYEPVEIDGSLGEGGGQVVRASVALSALTGRPLRLIRARARRKNPGLLAQHLTSVKAVATVCQASTENLRLGSDRFRFVPGPVRGGRFEFDVKTAGSTGLVVQAILPVLLRAPEPSEVVIHGGTHALKAPPFDHTEQALLPVIRETGAQASLRIERPGYFPKGGGRIVLEVRPAKDVRPLERTSPLEVISRDARVWCHGLPEHVRQRAEKALEAAGFGAGALPPLDQHRSGPGFAVALRLEGRGGATDVVSEMGEKGTPVEQVVARAVQAASSHEGASAPVGPHLADQLILPLAVGAGGRFRTVEPTLHFETLLNVLTAFVGFPAVKVQEDGQGTWLVEVLAVDTRMPGGS